ncbi:MAG: hypothetical protein O2992_10740 [Gemmatimonadetes bacterium]|nr:hypothetical protein [Gemmatimonadota bacterium]
MAQIDGRDTFRNVDRVYRRGLVLGLTLAELFLLLLFLLLLALAGTALRWLEEIQDVEILRQENVTLRQDLDDLKRGSEDIRLKLAAAGLDPSQINTLIESSRERARLQRQTEQLQRELDALRPLAEAGRVLQELQRASGLTPETIVKLKEELDALKPMAEAGRAFRELQQKLGLRPEEITDLKREIDALRSLAEAGKALKQLEDKTGLSAAELSGLKNQVDALKPLAQAGVQLAGLQEQLAATKGELDRLDAIANAKGIDPPCWYEEIPLQAGGTRERPVPLFDVAVFDEYLLVRDRPVPERYVVEKGQLPLAPVTFMQRLLDQEFVRMMRPIRQMAKEDRKVRPYSCVFFVNVWDETSSGSKERWKRATEGTIGAVFYRDTVGSESWEAGNE